ncbi:MAG: haloacid dehalogenase [Deltaproteobacteria bacterium]|nr:haloacid dehalogenase [Deltaproteobacteria bacterium]
MPMPGSLIGSVVRPADVFELGIDPRDIAFDVDSVFAQTMTLFVKLVNDRFGPGHLKYEDITSYYLADCLNLDAEVILELITLLIDKPIEVNLACYPGAPEVINQISRQTDILFVTARTTAEPIRDWIQHVLPEVDPAKIEVIATANHELKPGILLDHGKKYFVDDRLETCALLEQHGITPIIFDQPWNRADVRFLRVGNWPEIASLLDLTPGPKPLGSTLPKK